MKAADSDPEARLRSARLLKRLAKRITRHVSPITDGTRRASLAASIRLGALGSARRPLCLSFDIDRQGIGFFAELNWVLYCLAFAASVGARPRIRLRSLTYSSSHDDDRNWLAQYFDLSWMPEPNPSEHFVHAHVDNISRQLPAYDKRVGRLSLWEANDLASRYLQPLPAITTKVQQVIAEMGGAFVGIHWRGTDKKLEAPPISVHEIVQKAAEVCRALPVPPRSFFLATDEHELALILQRQLTQHFPQIPITTRNDCERSADGTPLHRRTGRNSAERYTLGEDALVDCLILSESSALIRSSSFLSAWCSVFNPLLPVYTLNTPFDNCLYFPEREVLHVSRYFDNRLHT